MVTVYHFKIRDPQKGEDVFQPGKSTAERIWRIGGDIIADTAEEVSFCALDAEGRYDRNGRLRAEQAFVSKAGNVEK